MDLHRSLTVCFVYFSSNNNPMVKMVKQTLCFFFLCVALVSLSRCVVSDFSVCSTRYYVYCFISIGIWDKFESVELFAYDSYSCTISVFLNLGVDIFVTKLHLFTTACCMYVKVGWSARDSVARRWSMADARHAWAAAGNARAVQRGRTEQSWTESNHWTEPSCRFKADQGEVCFWMKWLGWS